MTNGQTPKLKENNTEGIKAINTSLMAALAPQDDNTRGLNAYSGILKAYMTFLDAKDVTNTGLMLKHLGLGMGEFGFMNGYGKNPSAVARATLDLYDQATSIMYEASVEDARAKGLLKTNDLEKATMQKAEGEAGQKVESVKRSIETNALYRLGLI